MYFDPSHQTLVTLSGHQYALAREFYNNGPGYEMPMEELLTDWLGGTINSLMDPETPILETTRRNTHVKMTKLGFEFVETFEKPAIRKKHISKQFPMRIRVQRHFRRAEQIRLLKKIVSKVPQRAAAAAA